MTELADHESLLASRFAALATSERGDWADVLRRAQVASSAVEENGRSRLGEPSRPSVVHHRRALIVALVALILGIALFATPAFGVRDAVISILGRIDVNFRASDPAPQVVRWRFQDLALGASPRIAPQAIASEARTVGTLRLRGDERALWVVPTKQGGFCFMIENSHGACIEDRASRFVTVLPAVGFQPGGEALSLSISGNFLGERIERLTVEFADGESEDLDFVYVSPPIDAGFFAYAVPADRQAGPGRPRWVVARDGEGKVVARQAVTLSGGHIVSSPTGIEAARPTVVCPRLLPAVELAFGMWGGAGTSLQREQFAAVGSSGADRQGGYVIFGSATPTKAYTDPACARSTVPRAARTSGLGRPYRYRQAGGNAYFEGANGDSLIGELLHPRTISVLHLREPSAVSFVCLPTGRVTVRLKDVKQRRRSVGTELRVFDANRLLGVAVLRRSGGSYFRVSTRCSPT